MKFPEFLHNRHVKVVSLSAYAPAAFTPEYIPGTHFICRPGSSADIETDYGLDGPGSNPGEDEIFRPSRPALGPNQHPV